MPASRIFPLPGSASFHTFPGRPTLHSSFRRSRGRTPTGRRSALPPSRRTASISSGSIRTPPRPGSQYTRYHADTNAEEQADRPTYLAALGVPAIAGPDVPSPPGRFLRHLPGGDAVSFARGIPPVLPAFQGEPGQAQLPVAQGERARPWPFPLFEEAREACSRCSPTGGVLIAEPGSAPQARPLPSLPPGFRYTDFVKWGSSLVVAWEEISFTDVGRAGFLFYPLR